MNKTNPTQDKASPDSPRNSAAQQRGDARALFLPRPAARLRTISARAAIRGIVAHAFCIPALGPRQSLWDAREWRS